MSAPLLPTGASEEVKPLYTPSQGALPSAVSLCLQGNMPVYTSDGFWPGWVSLGVRAGEKAQLPRPYTHLGYWDTRFWRQE